MSIKEIITSDNLLVSIMLSGLAGIVRNINDSKKNKTKITLIGLFISLFLAASVGAGTYGIVKYMFNVQNTELLSSIMFIVGILYDEIIKIIIELFPKIIKNIINNKIGIYTNEKKDNKVKDKEEKENN